MNTSVVRIPPTQDLLVLRTLLTSPAEAIVRGHLVAFPTETVYGLGANALDATAVERVFAAKQRPADNPLIVHVSSPAQVPMVASSITPLAQELMDHFWPGPLTLILPAQPTLPKNVTAGFDSVAVRFPNHPIAQMLITMAGVPIVGPSANMSGRPSPTTAAHVWQDFSMGPDWIIDGGPCEIGIESTVVDARGTIPEILRDGQISREDLAPWFEGDGDSEPHGAAPARSPGTSHAHYRPRARVVVAQAGELWEVAAQHSQQSESVGVITSSDPTMHAGHAPHIQVVGMFTSVDHLGANLYQWLRHADEIPVEVVVVEAVPNAGLGRAVMDRMRRASLQD